MGPEPVHRSVTLISYFLILIVCPELTPISITVFFGIYFLRCQDRQSFIKTLLVSYK